MLHARCVQRVNWYSGAVLLVFDIIWPQLTMAAPILENMPVLDTSSAVFAAADRSMGQRHTLTEMVLNRTKDPFRILSRSEWH